MPTVTPNKTKKYAHQYRRQCRNLNITVSVKGSEACPNAHSEKCAACYRLNHKGLTAALVTGMYHFGKAVEAVQNRDNEYN